MAILFNQESKSGGGGGSVVSGSVDVTGGTPYRIELGFRATRVSLKAPTTTAGQFNYIFYDKDSVLGESKEVTCGINPTTGSTGSAAARDFPNTETTALRLQSIDDTGITIAYNRTVTVEYTAA